MIGDNDSGFCGHKDPQGFGELYLIQIRIAIDVPPRGNVYFDLNYKS
jgi:hypothetical protein